MTDGKKMAVLAWTDSLEDMNDRGQYGKAGTKSGVPVVLGEASKPASWEGLADFAVPVAIGTILWVLFDRKLNSEYARGLSDGERTALARGGLVRDRRRNRLT